MKIVIEIPDEAVKTDNIANDFLTYFECCTPKLFETLKNGKPLPKGHGDLIDAGKIQFENADFDTYGDYCRAFDAIDQADTIIEADKEGAE